MLQALAANDALWSGLPAIAVASAAKREDILRAVLDHLRGRLVIDTDVLSEASTREMKKRTAQWLAYPWALEENDPVQRARLALLPGRDVPANQFAGNYLRLGWRSAVGRYLRNRTTWEIAADLTTTEVEELTTGITARLNGHLVVIKRGRDGQDESVQLLAGALRWVKGDGQPALPDRVRARALHLRKEVRRPAPNAYFSRLYGKGALELRGMVAREHTGQVDAADRVQREDDFREGRLSALCCSPTMELGIDIRDLNAVHLRNVPPTPANYAQRSGRAGRGGRPALIVAFGSQGNVHDQYYFRKRARMVDGSVEPARMDLRNRDLVRAHLQSTWLARLGLSLGDGVGDLLDLDLPTQPLLADVQAQLDAREKWEPGALLACRQVIATVPEARQAAWFNDEWLESVVRNAPRVFDASFERWRELYRAATKARDAARTIIDSPKELDRAEKDAAERNEREARHELSLLRNDTRRIEESDFYPYRYLASEGFLPGYNFPRLPLRALVNVGDRSQSIDRPRFLGLTEFGPQNILYHEGRKFRIESVVLPPDSIRDRLKQALLCNACGYAHDDTTTAVCDHCRTQLDAAASDWPQKLLEQPTARTRAVERISAEEEERVRYGFDVTTHYTFEPRERRYLRSVRSSDADEVLQALYAPAAKLWRINRGWRRSKRAGFSLDPVWGRWAPRPNNNETAPRDGPTSIETGVKPFVTDSRNVLLLRPVGAPADDAFAVTLLYALRRAVQIVYQVEESEIAAELIGEGSNRRLLLWESAEGGVGVCERLADEANGFARLAHAGLGVCHFESRSGEDTPGWEDRCSRGCYECLLSYGNQMLHRLIDRRLVRDFLLALTKTSSVKVTDERDYDEQYRWLRELTGPSSSFERAFLDHIYAKRLTLPDHAQYRPDNDIGVQADFYYERPGVPGICVFIDGPHHDSPEQRKQDTRIRARLEDHGFGVIAIRHDRPLEEEMARHAAELGPER